MANLIDIVKNYFKTGDRPTQAQFYQFFEGIFFRDTGLGTKGVLNAAGTIEIPAEQQLAEIVFWTGTDQNVKVGDSAGANEHLNADLTANTPYSLDLALFSIEGQTIHLTGENLAPINYKIYVK